MIPRGEQIKYEVDRFGYAKGFAPSYHLRVLRQAVGANLIYFDLWNGSTDKTIKVFRLQALPELDTAVTGAVSVLLRTQRTTAIGTGGTLAVEESANAALTSFNRHDTRDPLLSALEPLITARLTPTGGATLGATVGEDNVFIEETSAASYFDKNLTPVPIFIAPGTGLRVQQGGVASVNLIGFSIELEVQRHGL